MQIKLLLPCAAAATVIAAVGVAVAPPYSGTIPVCGDIVEEAGQKLCLDTVVPGQLLCLPEIGEKRAEQIMRMRASEPGVNLQDLENISGISQRMVDLWKVYFCTQ